VKARSAADISTSVSIALHHGVGDARRAGTRSTSS
jgi:hypothetical protein